MGARKLCLILEVFNRFLVFSIRVYGLPPQNQKAFTHGIVIQVGRELDQDLRVHCVPIHLERYRTLVVDDQSLSVRCKIPTHERIPICQDRDLVNLGAFIILHGEHVFPP
jgi:hypothetical protein